MKKKSLCFLLTLALFAGKSFAQQHCYTDEVRKQLLVTHPEIAGFEAEMNRQIAEKIKNIDLGKVAYKTTTDQSGNKSFWYDIPVVVHIIHDYGQEYLKDDDIFNDLIDWNTVYAKQNPDTATVVAPFKAYIGNPHIRLHLATKDPNGNPTKGITRHRSYLATNGNDQAKIDDWQPTSYVNIWFIHNMSGANAQAAAYAYFPSTGAAMPYADGVIALYDYHNVDKTINHEMGHCFSLYHPWGNNNSAGAGTCSDGGTDEVDDTPPTIGHMTTGCTAAALYDTVCATNYFKIYTTATGDSLANYPDTTNSENIMDYTYCSKMFTKGQVERMHAALNSDIAGRNNLWDSTNLVRTGVINPSPYATYSFVSRPDLKPNPEFSSVMGGVNGKIQYFTCPGSALTFVNKSWNDTVTSVTFNFPTNGASPATTTIANPGYSSATAVTFSQQGWATVSMSATGNHTGDTTVTWNNAIYVADANATPASSIYEEFDPAGTGAKWPTFNYYNNEFQWQNAGVGYYDNHSMEYVGFDSRINPLLGIYPNTGSPLGDIDDMFSVPVDLSAYTGGSCNLNFMYSGASRSSNSADINDSLVISYSIDNAKTWNTVTTLKKSTLDNKGALAVAYAPLYQGDWAAKTIHLPAAALKPYVVFRFRYMPNVGADGIYSSGNNFYMDRVNFSPLPAEVSTVKTDNMDIVLAPNPTSNNAYVIVKDANNETAHVLVTDVAGRTVYTTSETINGTEARIEIPASAISVKGIYMVQTRTGSQTSTQKLVVY